MCENLRIAKTVSFKAKAKSIHEVHIRCNIKVSNIRRHLLSYNIGLLYVYSSLVVFFLREKTVIFNSDNKSYCVIKNVWF